MSLNKTTQPHILVVDDDEGILEAMRLILEEAGGYRTTLIADSKNLDETIEHDRPNLILLDMRLSGEDGSVIAQRLKKDPLKKTIPIVMVSANHEGERTARNAQVEGFLAKPFELTDLLAIVAKHAV